MKVFSVYGNSKTGKTTTIEKIIRELKHRRYSVGSIKEIHYEEFHMDSQGTNTDRHRKAGADLVTARGIKETNILYPKKISLPDILKHYYHDYVVCEGVRDYNLPKIITARTKEDLDKRWEKGIFAISGVIASSIKEYRGVPVINGMTEIERLVDLIEEKVFDLLPDVDSKCCNACGTDCRSFAEKILRGEADPKDCIQNKSKVKLYVNDQMIQMVPFVENIIKNTCIGLISQLDGYQSEAKIKIEIED